MTAEWRGPFWLKPFFGDSQETIFHRVTEVELRNRTAPDALTELRHLQRLSLSSCQVSRLQLHRLDLHHSLETLTLEHTHITDNVNPEGHSWANKPGDHDPWSGNVVDVCKAAIR